MIMFPLRIYTLPTCQVEECPSIPSLLIKKITINKYYFLENFLLYAFSFYDIVSPFCESNGLNGMVFEC